MQETDITRLNQPFTSICLLICELTAPQHLPKFPILREVPQESATGRFCFSSALVMGAYVLGLWLVLSPLRRSHLPLACIMHA